MEVQIAESCNADPPSICYGETILSAGVNQLFETEKETITPRPFCSEEEERILQGLSDSLRLGKAVVWEESSVVKRFIGYCFLAMERWTTYQFGLCCN